MKKFSKILGFMLTMAFVMSMLSVPTQAVQASSPAQVSVISISSPRISSPDASSVYVNGQSIKVNLNYGQKGLKITANLKALDATLSDQMFVKDNGTGTYTLVSPVLNAETMIVGSNLPIVFTARDANGQVGTASYFVNQKTRTLKGQAEINAPARVSAKAFDSQATIWWTKVPQAQKILVRYIDAQGVSRDVIVSKANSGKTITGLKNGYEYEFFVGGISESGSVGKLKSVKVTPCGPVVKAVSTPNIAVSPRAIGKGQVAVSKTQEVKVAQVETKQADVTTQVNDIKTKKINLNLDWNLKIDWYRVLLALAILLIAAGAAIGAYYGYEWWVAKKAAKPKTKEKETSKPKRGSRW